jgi:hypothetical protein
LGELPPPQPNPPTPGQADGQDLTANCRKALCIDLCCGTGGWAAGFLAEGYQVIGYDIYDQPEYPGELRRRDVRAVTGHDFRRPRVIVASPPCEEFSRHDQPWTRAKNPPAPDTSIWDACVRIAREAGAPLILENVRGAQGFMGRAACRIGPHYLWGNIPALMPSLRFGPTVGPTPANSIRAKGKCSGTDRASRARIPFKLAQWIARCFKPAPQEARP